MGFLSSLTGSSQAKAAKRAAKALQGAQKENIEDFRTSFDENQALLDSRIQAETLAANRLLSILQGNGSFRDDPLFQADLDDSIDSVNRSFAPTGKVLSGQRLLALRDANFGAEDRAVNRLLSFASPVNTNNLINLRNARDANIGGARVGSAEAYGAGQIGAANARAAGLGNLIQLGMTAAPAIGKGIGALKGMLPAASGGISVANSLTPESFGLPTDFTTYKPFNF